MTQIATVTPARVSTPAAFSGSAPRRLLQFGFQVNALRPYVGNDGQSYITVMEDGQAVPRPICTAAAFGWLSSP